MNTNIEVTVGEEFTDVEFSPIPWALVWLFFRGFVGGYRVRVRTLAAKTVVNPKAVS